MTRIALVQTSSQNDPAANLQNITRLARQAKAEGAEFILTPENALLMAGSAKERDAYAKSETEHPGIHAIQELTAELSVHFLIGSVAIQGGEGHRLLNRSLLLAPDGTILARYDKIHLYDASVSGGESHQESKAMAPGEKAVLADTPFGKLGLTICYDVRFPNLYRTLAQNGAQIITVPAAFTEYTGKAHWEVLLRARAIENGCYILAPAQTGSHPRGRKTYGHSLIISPWGEIIADGGTSEGIIAADIDLSKVTQTRESLPSLKHDRPFIL